MKEQIRIGTRDSQLAMWQAGRVAGLLQQQGHEVQIIAVKSEGDLNLSTPLYEMGVEGVFTRYLDAAVLDGKVDIAVHSMKDVPTVMAEGLAQAAVLQRGPVKDLLVYKNQTAFLDDPSAASVIATGSVRRKAQWLHRYPNSIITGLRGNVNTRLRKLQENDWDGALFAAAGLERIRLRPDNAIALDWMLPAPAQGAILVVCQKDNKRLLQACNPLNDANTALCTKIERDFLRTLLGGCATPISALATVDGEDLRFKGNILTPDGKEIAAIEKSIPLTMSHELGLLAGGEILETGGREIINQLTNKLVSDKRGK